MEDDEDRERGHWTPDWAGRGQDRPGEAQISGFKFGDVVVVSDVEICQDNKLRVQNYRMPVVFFKL